MDMDPSGLGLKWRWMPQDEDSDFDDCIAISKRKKLQFECTDDNMCEVVVIEDVHSTTTTADRRSSPDSIISDKHE